MGSCQPTDNVICLYHLIFSSFNCFATVTKSRNNIFPPAFHNVYFLEGVFTMLSTPRSIFSNMYFLAALIIVAILLIAALKFFFTYTANQYVQHNKTFLFSNHGSFASTCKTCGQTLESNFLTYCEYIDDLGISKVHNCSSAIVSSASNNPIKYLIKYSDIEYSTQCLEKIDFCIDFMHSIRDFHTNMASLGEDVHRQLPLFVRLFVTREKIPYTLCDVSYRLSKTSCPTFRFSYISAAGKSQHSYSILVTPNILEAVESEVNAKISKSSHASTQRLAMTNDLREAIKKRDNYTCCICGNSVFKEPNLLLEVDHIIPISKGGKTEASNLQTLCWRCNRKKSNK